MMRALLSPRTWLPLAAALALALAPLTPALPTQAQTQTSVKAGDLDASFGTGGKVNLGAGYGHIVAQSDGKIIVVASQSQIFGNLTIRLARYTGTGVLDSSFGTGGKVATELNYCDKAGVCKYYQGYNIGGVLVYPDGKILLVGDVTPTGGRDIPSDALLVRYNANGSLDTAFGVGGIVRPDFGLNDSLGDATLLRDGKIIVVGGVTIPAEKPSDQGVNGFLVARYTGTGVLDSSFGNSGKVTTRLNDTGIKAEGINVSTDGKITVGGIGHGDAKAGVGFARYTAAGALDTTFSGDGKVYFGTSTNPVTAGMVTLLDSKVLLAKLYSERGPRDTIRGGYKRVYDFGLERYEANTGTLDTTFGNGGKVNTNFGSVDPYDATDTPYAMAMQSDGKILLAGETSITRDDPVSSGVALARYTADGKLDTTFGNGGKVVTDFRPKMVLVYGIAVQHDRKILVLGKNKILRYHGDTVKEQQRMNARQTRQIGRSAEFFFPPQDQPVYTLQTARPVTPTTPVVTAPEPPTPAEEDDEPLRPSIGRWEVLADGTVLKHEGGHTYVIKDPDLLAAVRNARRIDELSEIDGEGVYLTRDGRLIYVLWASSMGERYLQIREHGVPVELGRYDPG